MQFFKQKNGKNHIFLNQNLKDFFVSQIIKFTNGRITNRQGRLGRFKKEKMKID